MTSDNTDERENEKGVDTEDEGSDRAVDDLATRIESRLMSHGVYVTALEEGSGGYEVTYESMAADGGVIPHREIGRVINVFRDLHDDWQGADIEGTVLDLDGEEQGRWRVDAEWLEKLQSGELTQIDFSERVIETVETEG